MKARRLLLVFVGCAALLLLATPGADARHLETYGHGPNEVWLLRPTSRIQSVVVFGHGWKTSRPSGLSWVDQFRPWLEHLLERGNAVIFPRYQLGTGDRADGARVNAYRRGLVLAFEHLGTKRVPVVAAGYSFGASLSFYYAANARGWDLPAPAAVDAVFPAGMIDGASLPSLARSTRVLIQVGDRDVEAGTAGGRAFWRWLGNHATGRHYETVRSTAALTATHDAPKEANAAAQRIFWNPLDGLVEGSRAPRQVGSVLLWLFAQVLEALSL